jgi:hypothetical protein
MLVMLPGAIGGMLHSGIIGLFPGSVVLALGFKLLQACVDAGPVQQPVETRRFIERER